jgi:hypothetical protein
MSAGRATGAQARIAVDDALGASGATSQFGLTKRRVRHIVSQTGGDVGSRPPAIHGMSCRTPRNTDLPQSSSVDEQVRQIGSSTLPLGNQKSTGRLTRPGVESLYVGAL